MKRLKKSRILWAAVICMLTILLGMLTGCKNKIDDQGKVKDLDYEIISEQDIPQELMQMIQEKKANSFKLTYSNDQGLYIVVGYGAQSTGGYSIAVKALYLTENSIIFDTELVGPEKGSASEAAASYPYIVVKTEYIDLPVVFQ